MEKVVDLGVEEDDMGLISWIVVGLIAGWLTGKIMGGPSKGVLMDIIIGLVGAVAGGFLVGLFGLRPEGGIIYTIIVAVIGAVVLTWIYRKVTAR
ncbi:MAG: GlsB/YeaQ/YmgE family stress response membrane protein [Anaeromyxobacter sp.]